jgi:hypothetical protein
MWIAGSPGQTTRASEMGREISWIPELLLLQFRSAFAEKVGGDGLSFFVKYC